MKVNQDHVMRTKGLSLELALAKEVATSTERQAETGKALEQKRVGFRWF